MGASRVACASFDLGTNTTITITRDKKTYTHTLKYSFNGATGTIVTKTTATTYVWTPPEDTFYSKIPNTTSGYGTITCETYDGSKLIGTTTAGFYAYTVKSDCEPVVSGTVVDTNEATIALTGDSNALVLYLSKPKCTLTATAKNSASIKTIQIENPVGLVATASPYTFDTVYSDEFRFKATDSRGYSKTATVKANKFIIYEPCHFDNVPILSRTESTSTTATTTLKGYCFNGSFGSASNTLTVKYRYKTSNGAYGSYTNITPTWNTDGSFTTNLSIQNLSLSETYTVEAVVEDKLSSFPVEMVLGQGMGDLRIAKEYIQTKNKVVVGGKENIDWKCVALQRKLNGNYYSMNYGIGAMGGALELRKASDYGEGNIVARYDMREDGYLYNTISSMSVAEIMSMLPNITAGGPQGYFLLNGGDSATPVLVQWGRVSVTPTSANVVTKQAVSFTRQFSSNPFVCSDQATADPANVSSNVGDVSKNGFNIYLHRTNTTATTVLWLAIGDGTASMPE